MSLWDKLFRRQPRRYTLFAMRLADMHMIHPEMDVSHVCSRCGHQLGVYPSGQAMLAEHAGEIDLECQRCMFPQSVSGPSPQQIAEMGESKPR